MQAVLKPLAALALTVIVALSGCIGADPKPAASAPSGTDSPGDSSEPSDSQTPSSSDPTSSETPDPSDIPENHAPTANLSASVAAGGAPLLVNFTITGADEDGDNLTYSLDADGDGIEDANGTELPAEFAFTYSMPGNYTAVLNVTDGTASATATVAIAVAASGPCGSAPEPCKVSEDLWVEFWSDGVCHAKGEVSQGALYVHDRPDPGSPNGYYDGGGTWFYEESNGLAGLQIGGQSILLGADDQEPVEYRDCVSPDTLIF